MKRIGLVTGQLGYGGAEKQTVLLAQGLKDIGQYEPIVFCLSRTIEPNGVSLTKNSIEWYMVPDYKGNLFQKVLWLCRQTRRANISLLYGILNVGNVYVAISGLVNRLPYICSIRNADPFLSLPLRILSRWSCNWADFVIANSASCVRSLRDDLRVQHNRIAIIGNAFDFLTSANKTREMIRAEWGFSNDTLVVGTVSNLKKQKNPLYFIEVFKALTELSKQTPFCFVWVGDGLERGQVENAVVGLDADKRNRIIFPGARSDNSNVLKAFDVFILTSSYEGLPNALMEAMASGLPCVATNVSGTKDVLSDVGNGEEIGVLASSSNPQEFAETLLELLNDPVRMKRMGKSAQKHVQDHYSLEKMVVAHCNVFEDVLALKKEKI